MRDSFRNSEEFEQQLTQVRRNKALERKTVKFQAS
jgi:hypothetical protein